MLPQKNQWTTVWVLEHARGGPALLLYGFASLTARPADHWRRHEIKLPASRAGSRSEFILSQLMAVLDSRSVEQIFADLASGELKINANRKEPFTIIGKWMIRAETEAPPPHIHPFTLKLTNLAASGAAVRRTAWQISFDPLGEFLQTFSPGIDLREIRMSNDYLCLLETLQKETGLVFRGDDIVQLGNFDWYRNRIGADYRPDFSGVNFHTITETSGDEKKVVGLKVKFSRAVVALAPLIVKVELHSSFDRTLCKIQRFDAKGGDAIEIRPPHLETYCGYSVEVYQEDTGDPITSEGYHIIRSMEGNMLLLGQQRDIETPWATRQKQAQPGISTANITKTTLHTFHPMMEATLSRDFKDDPWNFLTRRRGIITKKESRLDEYLQPVIENVSDEKRIAPLLKLLNSEQFPITEIYDPYFDQTAVQKLLLRVSAQDHHIIVFTNGDDNPTRINELKTILEKAVPFLPCRITVNVLAKSFHDRFLVLKGGEETKIYVLTNSLDKYNCSYPLFIVPLEGTVARAAHRYLKNLCDSRGTQAQENFTKLFDSLSANELRTKARREALAKLGKPDAYSHLDEYQVISKSGLLVEGKVPADKTSTFLTSLFQSKINFENLASLAYMGILNHDEAADFIIEKLGSDTKLIDDLEKEIRFSTSRVLPDAIDFRALAVFQLFDSLAEKRHSPKFGIADVYRELKNLFNHFGPLHLPSPHSVLLWEWLALANPSKAYDLFIELRDMVWVVAFAGELYWNSEFAVAFVKFANTRPDDNLLFVLALILVTGSRPRPSPKDSAVTSFDFLSTWESRQRSLLSGRLGTFAALVAFGDAKDKQIPAALDLLLEHWKLVAPNDEEFDEIDRLARSGIPEMRHARVYKLYKALAKLGQANWANKLEQRLLGSFIRNLRADPGSFHYYHPEDNPLLFACQEVICIWPPEKRIKWFEECLSSQALYVPNRPFLKTRNHDLFATSINQIGLWLILRLAVSNNSNEAAPVWADFKKYLLPAAYSHDDYFKILSTLASHLREKIDPALSGDWDATQQEAKDQLCEWWPFGHA